MPKSKEISKEVLKELLVEQIEQDFSAALLQQKTAQEAATHEEARAENDKDTRGLESSYLARGLARRVQELKASLVAIRGLSTRDFTEGNKVGLASLVVLEDESGDFRHYWLSPLGGGLSATVQGKLIKVVTPNSPLGKALMGRELDDEVWIHTPKGRREAVIVDVL